MSKANPDLKCAFTCKIDKGCGEAIWHNPEGELAYGKFFLKELEYNE